MTEHDASAGLHVDPEGYVRSPSGCKLGRITGAGELYLWDSRTRCERRLTVAELARLIAEVKGRQRQAVA